MPKVLTEHGKTKNPWPNVDAHSGVLLMVRPTFSRLQEHVAYLCFRVHTIASPSTTSTPCCLVCRAPWALCPCSCGTASSAWYVLILLVPVFVGFLSSRWRRADCAATAVGAPEVRDHCLDQELHCLEDRQQAVSAMHTHLPARALNLAVSAVCVVDFVVFVREVFVVCERSCVFFMVLVCLCACMLADEEFCLELMVSSHKYMPFG